jgi:cytochrome d ubiquinol oxidase subunit II
MDLNTLWFILIAVLFIGYFFLEGFDYGVGILLPFLAKQDQDRRVIINTVGPHWDGNEVWLLTAGGAIFAAFSQGMPLFSGFYLALVLMLIGLIVRGVAFEFRSKDANPKWRSFWDWMIFLGSFLPALLWGVALANILKGVPIDAEKNYVGGFFNLLNPYALLAGLTSLVGFTLHGAIFLALKTTDELKVKAHAVANKLWLPSVVLIMAL